MSYLKPQVSFSWNFRLSTVHVKCHQNGTLIGSFCRKHIKSQPKKHRWVVSHDIKEWCKIWRKTYLLFKNDKNFQVSKTYTLIGPFCAKYLTLDLKMYRGVIFHDTEESCKIWRKIDLWHSKKLTFQKINE